MTAIPQGVLTKPAWRAVVQCLSNLQRGEGPEDVVSGADAEVECLAAQLIWWDPCPVGRHVP